MLDASLRVTCDPNNRTPETKIPCLIFLTRRTAGGLTARLSAAEPGVLPG